MAKILVVDDDKSIVALIQAILGREGHEVRTAGDGHSGCEMARAERPDLIVLDVMLPGMDGFSVSGELFKDPEMRKIPIMVLTAKGNTRDIFELVPNVRFHMQKPFDPPEFVKKIRQILTA